MCLKPSCLTMSNNSFLYSKVTSLRAIIIVGTFRQQSRSTFLFNLPTPNHHQPCRFSKSGRIPGWPWEVIEFYDDVEPYYISLNTFATKLHIATLESQRFAFYHSSVEILPPMLEVPPKLGVSPPMFAILLPPLVGVLPPICNKIAEEEHCVIHRHPMPSNSLVAI